MENEERNNKSRRSQILSQMFRKLIASKASMINVLSYISICIVVQQMQRARFSAITLVAISV
jgi:hypothetical protein